MGILGVIVLMIIICAMGGAWAGVVMGFIFLVIGLIAEINIQTTPLPHNYRKQKKNSKDEK